MRAHLPCLIGLVLLTLPATWGQNPDPFSQLVSQALSIYTEVRSGLSVQATATTSSTTSTSSSSSSSTRSSTFATSTSTSSSTRSSTFATSASTPIATSTRITRSTQSASNTAEAAAAASSSAAAAVAAARSQNNKNRTTAIVLGVVLGLLALAALIGLLYFCLRRRRRQRAVGSRRSVSPDAVGGASWGKEPLGNLTTTQHTSPGYIPTNERHHTPVGAAAPRMSEHPSHRYDAHTPLGNNHPIPHRDAPSFQPDLMHGAPGSQGPYHNSSGHIPLSSHSRSNLAAAGLGGAALGALGAKHHDEKHDERDFTSHPDDKRQSISRKPIGGTCGQVATDQSSNMGGSSDTVPRYQAVHSGSLGDMAPSSNPARMTDSTTPGNGNPPVYNDTAHPLSSHPPFAADNTHRSSTGHEPLTAGAAAGAFGAAALSKHHDPKRQDHNSSLTGRRSWDPNRQTRNNPQSILANASNRRSTGSTNPYVQARSPRRARFSNDVTDADYENLPQHSNTPFPPMEHSQSPQQLPRPDSYDRSNNNGSPRRTTMPGSWRSGSGSGSEDSHRNSNNNNTNRRSSGNDIIITGVTPKSSAAEPSKLAQMNQSPTLSELRQQEEDGWYRGRYMGDDARPPPPPPVTGSAEAGRTGSGSGVDQRYYAANNDRRKVGQAM